MAIKSNAINVLKCSSIFNNMGILVIELMEACLNIFCNIQGSENSSTKKFNLLFLGCIIRFTKQVSLLIPKNLMVECPICRSKFESFEPFGTPLRNNAKCKNCRSLERHRLLWIYINLKTDLLYTKSKLLHFAPEKSLFKIFSKSKYVKYYPCDLRPDRYDYDPDFKVEMVDIINIPYSAGFFNVILCSHVLHLVEDDISAVVEAYRVLKKGGWCIFQVPIDNSAETTKEISFNLPISHDAPTHFPQLELRTYGRDFKDRLTNAGFKVFEENFTRMFSPLAIHKFGIKPNELIYLCKK